MSQDEVTHIIEAWDVRRSRVSGLKTGDARTAHIESPCCASTDRTYDLSSIPARLPGRRPDPTGFAEAFDYIIRIDERRKPAITSLLARAGENGGHVLNANYAETQLSFKT